jgi:hypothetical protein
VWRYTSTPPTCLHVVERENPYLFYLNISSVTVFNELIYQNPTLDYITIHYYFIIIFSGSAAQRGLWPAVALQPSAGYGLLWLCSPARAMACCGSAAQRGLWPPRSRDFLITQNDAPQPVKLLWKSDQLVAETTT